MPRRRKMSGGRRCSREPAEAEADGELGVEPEEEDQPEDGRTRR